MDDRWANRAFWIGWSAAAVVLLVLASKQWFVRDDWAVVLTRQADKAANGGVDWLLAAQDGHWMTVPVLLWDVTLSVFGLDSYWPYLVPAIAAYLATIVLVRIVCRRAGVSAWTTTIICVLLACFGAGYENLVFAVQITYNLSLLAFFAQIVLIDHEGPPDWRDAAGGLIAIVGVMSSGFGPFFLFGAALMLVLQRRFLSLGFLAPAGLALAWWYLTYGSDGAARNNPGSKSLVPEFAYEGMSATFRALVAGPGLAGLAMLACLGVAVWLRHDLARQAAVLACATTAAVMFIGIGIQRVGLGIDQAAISRYVGIGAVLLAPLLALTVDQLARLGEPALQAGRLVLLASVVLNLGRLWNDGVDWANRSAADRNTMELVAGSPRLAEADPEWNGITIENPDVRVADISRLVELGALSPRSPRTTQEEAAVDAALGLVASASQG